FTLNISSFKSFMSGLLQLLMSKTELDFHNRLEVKSIPSYQQTLMFNDNVSKESGQWCLINSQKFEMDKTLILYYLEVEISCPNFVVINQISTYLLND
ncbi:MAG: hypothetical protein ACRC2N_06985, partial [Aeromonas sp.]